MTRLAAGIDFVSPRHTFGLLQPASCRLSIEERASQQSLCHRAELNLELSDCVASLDPTRTHPGSIGSGHGSEICLLTRILQSQLLLIDSLRYVVSVIPRKALSQVSIILGLLRHARAEARGRHRSRCLVQHTLHIGRVESRQKFCAD